MTSLCRNWDILNKWVSRAKQIAGSGISKIIVNEAENGIYGACMGEVMKKHGIKVYNTMNGLKAGQAQDAHVNFSKWFVWDEQMKKMLMEKCGLDQGRLVVCGHLMEDFAHDYVNHDSLAINREVLKNRKIISVFSIRSKREAKLLALNYLYDLVRNDESLVLIVRPHPSEKEEDFVLPDFQSERIHWVKYNQENSKSTLYDQISMSDVCVVFGSTVALECKWFGKSCISFETRETSLLYFAEGYDTLHVNTIDTFKSGLKSMLAREEKARVSKTDKKVAKRMVEYLSEN